MHISNKCPIMETYIFLSVSSMLQFALGAISIRNLKEVKLSIHIILVNTF